jgi:hypothetical protein
VDHVSLRFGGAGQPITPDAFAASKFLDRAMHADEYDIDTCHNFDYVIESPWLAQHVIHHDVVSGLRHRGYRAVVSSAGATQHLVDVCGIQLLCPCRRAHGAECSMGMWNEGMLKSGSKCAVIVDFPELDGPLRRIT